VSAGNRTCRPSWDEYQTFQERQAPPPATARRRNRKGRIRSWPQRSMSRKWTLLRRRGQWSPSLRKDSSTSPSCLHSWTSKISAGCMESMSQHPDPGRTPSPESSSAWRRCRRMIFAKYRTAGCFPGHRGSALSRTPSGEAGGLEQRPLAGSADIRACICAIGDGSRRPARSTLIRSQADIMQPELVKVPRTHKDAAHTRMSSGVSIIKAEFVRGDNTQIRVANRSGISQASGSTHSFWPCVETRSVARRCGRLASFLSHRNARCAHDQS